MLAFKLSSLSRALTRCSGGYFFINSCMSVLEVSMKVFHQRAKAAGCRRLLGQDDTEGVSSDHKDSEPDVQTRTTVLALHKTSWSH